MKRLVLVIVLILITVLSACREQSKEEVFQQGVQFAESGKHKAAVNLFKEALEKDPNYIDARYQLGISYLELNKLDKAEKELEKVRLQNPEDVDVSLRLSEIYLATNRPEKAMRQLSDMSKSEPENPQVLHFLARAHAMSNDLSSAEKLFRKSLRLRPGHARTQLGLTQLLFMTGRTDEADRLVEDIIESHPDNTDAHYMLMKKSLREGRREDAIRSLENIRSIKPDDMYATYILGLLYIDVGKIDSARKIAADLMTDKPDHPVGYRIDGVALYQTGDFKEAVDRLQKSVTGMPDLAGFYFLGLATYRSGQFEQAISSFQKALDKSPDHVQSRLMVAQTLLKQGRIEDCIRQADLIIDKDPSNAIAHNILGSAYLIQGKYDRAMEEIDKTIELNPELAQAHLKKGLLNFAGGKRSRGEIDLSNAVEAAPEVLNNRLLLATYHLKMNNYPKAQEVLKEGLALSSDSAVIYNFMAAAQFGQNQPESAVQSLQKAKTLKPEFVAPYLNLARYHIRNKNYQAALTEYQAILDFDPDHVQVLLKTAALQEFLDQDDDAEKFYQRAALTRDPQGYLALASFQRRDGQAEEALQTLEAGYNALPENPEIIMAYADVLKDSGQFDEAISAYIHLDEIRPGEGRPLLLGAHLQKGDLEAAKKIAERALIENPSSNQGYLFQMALHEHRSEMQLAEEALKRGLAATDGDLTLKMNLARLYSKRAAYDDALKLYDGILAEKPDLKSVIFAKASIHDVMGDKKKAQNLYERLLNLDENYLPALNNLAYLLLDVYADNRRALELASKGFRMKPNDPRIIDTLGYALLKNGQAEKAIAFLEKAASLMPEETEIRIHLARAYKAAGRNNEAMASLTAIQEMDARDSQLQEVETLLKGLN